jgi:hypothetical protein
MGSQPPLLCQRSLNRDKALAGHGEEVSRRSREDIREGAFNQYLPAILWMGRNLFYINPAIDFWAKESTLEGKIPM